MNIDNIILIGMPGSGKSTIGVLLAKMLGYSFIDSDLIIQHAEGMKLYEILRDKGRDYFSKRENQINSEIHAHKTVIATGGSAVYGKEAMRHLKSIGTVVYLKVSLPELARRIKNPSTRGIVMDDGVSLADLYNEREPLYASYADITVNCSKGSLQKNAERIIKLIGGNN